MDWISPLWLTLWTALLSVALDLPWAILVAWWLAKKNWWGKSILETCLALPLVIPPVATGLILLKLLSPHHFFGAWLHSLGIQIIFTWKAVVLALAVMIFPLMVRSLRTAFEEVPTRLEFMASSLGASPLRVFWTITFPLARRGVFSGMILGFARALGEFGATMMIAGMMEGETKTLSLALYQSVQMGEEPQAFTFLWISLLLAFGSLWLSEHLNKRQTPR